MFIKLANCWSTFLKKAKNTINVLRLIFTLKKIRVIVWDLDGTLYSNKNLVNKLKNVYIRSYSKSHNFKEKIGRKKFLEEEKQGKSWYEILKPIPGQTKKETILKNEHDFSKSNYLKKDELIVSVLKQLNRKHKNIIFSNSIDHHGIQVLQKIGIDKNSNNKIFTKKFFLNSFTDAKPLGNSFQVLNSYLSKEHAQKSVLYIGDSLSEDIVPAKKNGFVTIFINRDSLKNNSNFEFKDHTTLFKSLNIALKFI